MTATILVLLACPSALPPDDRDSPKPEAICAAVEKALPLILKSTAEYPESRDCFSCHHQAVPVLALSTAKARGFAIPPEAITDPVELTEADLRGSIESYKKGDGQGGGVTRAGYALFTLEVGGIKPDDVTDAVAEYLLRKDESRDHWRGSSNRPPSEASELTATYLALRALAAYGKEAQKDQVAARVEKARRWLEATKPKDTEDRVFRLLAMKAASCTEESIRKATDDLLASQRDDGGWSQLDGGTSDAYATGSAVVALHLAGGLATDSPAYRGGLGFLIADQRAEGSWFVRSRSKPFQPYFESGFPYGKDQFISMAASSWAVTACPWRARSHDRSRALRTTRLGRFGTQVLLSLCLGTIPLQGVAGGQAVRDAVKYGEAVVCLGGDGRCLAWDAGSGDFKPELASELSKAKLVRIGSNGKRIWGVREKKLLEWSPGTKTWQDIAEFESGGEELASLAVVGETPLLIYPTRVLSPIEGRVFEVPQLRGQFNNLRKLRVLAVQPTDRILWIGTGYGEWGGHLVGLDVRAGRWVQFYDALHYVTGIARGPKDEPIVSWSMSHFNADTLIRVHKPDATPEVSYPELEGKYYQKVAYNPFDKRLYGLEGRTVVSITEGKPATVLRLEVQVFEREPRAIGVAPGILALIPVAPETLIVVPTRSAPLMLRDRKLIPLRAPASRE